MLARARAISPGAIDYRRADLATLVLPESSCDFAWSSLALHYLEYLAPVFARVHRALVPGGEFVFSMEHPVCMAAENPGWLPSAEGGKVWPVSHYAEEGPRITHWLAPGVVK